MLELRELTAPAESSASSPRGPARSYCVRRGWPSTATPGRFVESRDTADWMRDEDREPLALLRELLFSLEQLGAEATRAALSPADRSRH